MELEATDFWDTHYNYVILKSYTKPDITRITSVLSTPLTMSNSVHWQLKLWISYSDSLSDWRPATYKNDEKFASITGQSIPTQ